MHSGCASPMSMPIAAASGRWSRGSRRAWRIEAADTPSVELRGKQIMRFNILVVPYMLARGERVPLAGSDPARFQQLMHRVRDQMQFAEQLGYSGFCMTEQHMQIEGIETTTNPLF